MEETDPPNAPRLRRSLSQTQLILYGVGTTVGAGIYALIGEIAKAAGFLAAASFIFAATLALFSALTFANLSRRFPKAAGLALYIQEGLGSVRLAQLAGIGVIAAGLVSSATLLNGFVGYAQEFVPLEAYQLIVLAACLLAVIACWGIGESVWLAGIITLLEVGALIWVTVLAMTSLGASEVAVQRDFATFVPAPELGQFSVIVSGAVLAFYAYIGFEDMVEVAEEVVDVRRTLPRAIILTLCITTLLYLSLVVAAMLAVGPAYLADSSAPLTDLTRALSSVDPGFISLIGMFAIVNGVLIQIIMASRVMYGLASRRQLPAWMGRVHPRTQTPVLATGLASAVALGLALIGQLAELAKLTSVIILVLFAGANLSLFKVLRRESSKEVWLMVSSLTGTLVCLGLVGQTLYGWIEA